MIIQEQYDVEIFIDDINVFTTAGVGFISANIYEAIMNPLPTCKISLLVPIAWFDEQSIVDGSVIKYIIKCDALNINETYTFRLYNINNINVLQQFMQIEIEGILDFYKGYQQGNIYNLFGTSSDVFTKIASENTLDSDIDLTTDSQLWVAGENNIYQFMSFLTQRGWINETSGMFWCFNRHKKLLYKNITDLFKNKQTDAWKFIQRKFPNFAKKEYVYSNIKATTQSGINNLKNGGYGSKNIYFDLIEYIWKKVEANKVTAESKMINISKELSQGLCEKWYPFEVGNFHENYELALKQNKRILSTFSTYITADTQFFQGFDIASLVDLTYTDSQNPDMKVEALSGIGIITAINTSITNTSLSSKFEIAMQGLNSVSTKHEVF